MYCSEKKMFDREEIVLTTKFKDSLAFKYYIVHMFTFTRVSQN